eukprot:GHVT01029576.1.p1 GENE.GHVT01029576.1~~GHVT01029576.1.p1  ORF type:complete len:370 (+),score=75.46 GHVT01029576.1:181-1290(+)
MAAVGMPPHLLSLFRSRPALPFEPPPRRGRAPVYDGMSAQTSLFDGGPAPPVIPFETPKERLARQKKEKQLLHEKSLRELVQAFSPNDDPNLVSDPFRTLFVARISYETTEKRLRKEFEVYGRIRSVKLTNDLNGKPRGYAFIEYEDDRDMTEAYKRADGKKIDGRRVLVDVERARTVPGWLPRRLGGGRGPPRFTPAGAKPVNAAPVGADRPDRHMERERGPGDRTGRPFGGGGAPPREPMHHADDRGGGDRRPKEGRTFGRDGGADRWDRDRAQAGPPDQMQRPDRTHYDRNRPPPGGPRGGDGMHRDRDAFQREHKDAGGGGYQSQTSFNAAPDPHADGKRERRRSEDRRRGKERSRSRERTRRRY